GQGDLVGVDDDDEVTAVDVGGERRLVLAAQQVGCRDGKAAKHHVRGVDDVPRPRGVTRLGRIGGHSAYHSFSASLCRGYGSRVTPGAGQAAFVGLRWGLISATDIDPRPRRTARQPSSLPIRVPAGQNGGLASTSAKV